MDAMWVVVLAAMALMVRAGQTVGAMGLSRAKNVASAGIRSLTDLCIVTLCFWAIGSAILFYQSNAFFGVQVDYLIGWRGLSPHWFGMLVMILLGTGIIAPAVAERSKLIVPLTVSALTGGLLIPIVGKWIWYGWLTRMGVIDIAGASVIHLVPAVAATIAAIFVGAREGKYNRDGSSNMIPGHSVLMILLSAALTLVGWIPYVLIRSLPGSWQSAVANVMVSAAAGGAASLIIAHIRFGKADVLLICSGILGALVSITAAGGAVGTPAAFVIGVVAGMVVPWMTIVIDLQWKIDDPAGIIAVHGIGAIWAMIAAGIFVPQLTPADRLKQIGIQLLAIVVAAIVAAAFTAIVMLLLRALTGLRSKEADEYDGLDLAEHDINAHPDFQQTMIKSYHLREA